MTKCPPFVGRGGTEGFTPNIVGQLQDRLAHLLSQIGRALGCVVVVVVCGGGGVWWCVGGEVGGCVCVVSVRVRALIGSTRLLM